MSVAYLEPLIQDQQAASTRSDHVYQVKWCHCYIRSHAVTAYTTKSLSLAAFEWVRLPDGSLR